MTKNLVCRVLGCAFLAGVLAASRAAQPRLDFSPKPDESQVPLQMHSRMKDLPHIKVGRADADLVGADNRMLQAAVDYVAALGGGVVEIGPGEYEMRDSLHLRPN